MSNLNILKFAIEHDYIQIFSKESERITKNLLNTTFKCQTPNQPFGIETYNLLNLACHYGRKDIVCALIQLGADVNKAVMDTGHAPMYVAARQGHLDIVEILLNKKADIKKRTFLGTSPFIAAVAFRRTNVVRCLLENGADVNEIREGDISNICIFGEHELFALLFEYKAEILTSDIILSNSLSIAIANNRHKLVNLLIEHKANVNLGNIYYSNSLLECAATQKGSQPKEYLSLIVNAYIEQGNMNEVIRVSAMSSMVKEILEEYRQEAKELGPLNIPCDAAEGVLAQQEINACTILANLYKSDLKSAAKTQKATPGSENININKKRKQESDDADFNANHGKKVKKN